MLVSNIYRNYFSASGFHGKISAKEATRCQAAFLIAVFQDFILCIVV